MPIPSPSKKETREKFVARCMSSDVMKKEFPENKQRLAVCFNRWKTKNKKSSYELADDSSVEKLIEAFLIRHPELISKE